MPKPTTGSGPNNNDPSTGEWVVNMIIFLALLSVAAFFMSLIDHKP